MSIAQMGIGIAFFGSLHFDEKLLRVWKQPFVWIFFGFFLWHILGVFYSDNTSQGWNDIRIKMPLFTFSVAAAVFPQISINQLRRILRFFVLSCITTALIGLGVYFYKKFYGEQIDFRNLSPFISHIRFSLMIAFSLMVLGLGLIRGNEKYLLFEKRWNFLAFVFLLCYLFILKSITGIFIFLIVGAGLLVYFIIKSDNFKLKLISLSVLIGAPVVFALYGIRFWNQYFTEKDRWDDALIFTQRGNLFEHFPEREGRENGYNIWMNINFEELQQAWDSVSNVPFWGVSKSGYNMDITIIRYLSSKGLTKEAESIKRLSQEDITAIENGCANYLYRNSLSPISRLHQTFWEINDYLKYGDPNDKSLIMRVELWKIAIYVIKNNLWWGVGTGDVKDEMLKAFEKNNSKLQEGYRLRPHNQFLTIGIALGIFALIMFPISLLFPLLISQKQSLLFTIFCFITLLSMMNEDTLETQAGATFISFFYCLLLYGTDYKTSTPK